MAATFVVAKRMIRKEKLAGLPANDPDSIMKGAIASPVAACLDLHPCGILAVAAFPGRQKKVGFDSVLLGVQVVITSTEGVKGLVGSALNNAPRLHHQNLICASNRRKPVRDYKRRAPAHEVAQALLN